MYFLFMILTLAISFFNAWSVGSVWLTARMQGGFAWLTAVAGAVMSAIGFSMVYAAVLIYAVIIFHLASPHTIVYFNALFPAFIILPLLMAGVIITLQSWKAVFARGQGGLERTLNVAGAVWNTYAMSQNILETPAIFSKVFSIFDDRDRDTDGLGVASGLAIMAILSGGLTTWFIIKKAVGRSVDNMHDVLKEHNRV